jgi:tetratricopeptide (TPR) repeat protein
MRRTLGRIVLALGVTCGSTAAAQEVPRLPVLAIDQFPPAAKEPITAAYAEAQRRPSDASAVGALARTLHAWEQWEGAHQAYTRAHAIDPTDPEWPYLDAVVLQRLARHGEAVARLERALAIGAPYLPARVRLAEALLEAGDLDRSRAAFEAVLGEPAAEPAARMGLGRIAAAQGRSADAITHFEKAVALFPELGAGYYALARAYRAAGRTDDAQRALERHQQYGARWPALDDPVLAAVTRTRADPRALLQRGVDEAKAGNIEAAIASHEAALQADSTLAQAHADLVNFYGRVRNWEKAEAHYRAAVAEGLDLADAHYDYGVVLGLQGKWEPAEEAYRKALAANPQHAQARNNLGQIIERRRDFEGAASEYRRALDVQPGFRLARFNLGRMLLALGRADDAIAELEKLVEPRDAEAPRYLFGLATAHVRAGHRDEGLEWAREAQKLARAHGQEELAAAIEREIAKIK